MFALVSLMSLISQVSGTPYIPGGDTPAGTDCSGLASWVANVASGRPAFGSRFNTGNIEPALLARGFHYGSAPNSVVIGWNSGHAAVTLPDGTPVSSGESGRGVRVGGGGAYQPQFSHHMYLPMAAQEMNTDAPAAQQSDSAEPQDLPTEAPAGAGADLPEAVVEEIIVQEIVVEEVVPAAADVPAPAPNPAEEPVDAPA